MYLFDGCQYGGHTVTVVDDLGASFLHISGNTGDAIAVGIGEAKRLTSEPKVKSGGAFKISECNKVATAEERDSVERLHRRRRLRRQGPDVLDHSR